MKGLSFLSGASQHIGGKRGNVGKWGEGGASKVATLGAKKEACSCIAEVPIAGPEEPLYRLLWPPQTESEDVRQGETPGG